MSKGDLSFMNQDKFNSILNDAVNDSDLSENEIPQIDLYLEQIIRLISDKNLQGSPSYYHRFPTKTMVNNYSKAGLISPLKGKTYNKEQIIQILLTNSLKNRLWAKRSFFWSSGGSLKTKKLFQPLFLVFIILVFSIRLKNSSLRLFNDGSLAFTKVSAAS